MKELANEILNKNENNINELDVLYIQNKKTIIKSKKENNNIEMEIISIKNGNLKEEEEKRINKNNYLVIYFLLFTIFSGLVILIYLCCKNSNIDSN